MKEPINAFQMSLRHSTKTEFEQVYGAMMFHNVNGQRQVTLFRVDGLQLATISKLKDLGYGVHRYTIQQTIKHNEKEHSFQHANLYVYIITW